MSKVSKKKDTISKIKKDEEKSKPTEIVQNDDDYQGGSDEEDQTRTAGVVKEQAVQSSDKPKGLKDLFGTSSDKPTTKKQTQHKPKQEKKEEGKNRFFNSKGAPKHLEAKPTTQTKTEEPTKKVYDTKGLTEAAKENSKVKAPKKSYLDADVKKAYKEEEKVDIAKPEFKNLKIGNENFVELNHQEDLLAKNLAEKNFEFKKDYADENKDKPEKKKNYKHPHKYHKKEEITNDVDSDGFEVIGTKEQKKEAMPKKKSTGGYKKKHYKKNNGTWKKEEKKEEAKEGEEQKEETKEDKKEEAKEEKKEEKSNVVVIKVDTKGAKSLKDMFD